MTSGTDVRSKASRQSYDPQQRGDTPVHNEEECREWLRESRRRKCLPERIEIFNVIQGQWIAVTQENLAAHYARGYWNSIGLGKAWEEIETGAIADPEAELTFREDAEFLGKHVFGTLRETPETPDERISVIVEDFYSVREEQERAPPPPPPLPTFEERLDARMPEVLEIWAASQTGHITSRLVVEDLLHYQWPISTVHQRALVRTMRQAEWSLQRTAKKGSELKTHEDDIALLSENTQWGRALKGGKRNVGSEWHLSRTGHPLLGR